MRPGDKFLVERLDHFIEEHPVNPVGEQTMEPYFLCSFYGRQFRVGGTWIVYFSEPL